MSLLAVAESQLKFSAEMPDNLKQLLIKYQEVFSITNGLPPSRLCNHRILLQPNSKPIKIKPYRFPCSQKSEIESMVN